MVSYFLSILCINGFVRMFSSKVVFLKKTDVEYGVVVLRLYSKAELSKNTDEVYGVVPMSMFMCRRLYIRRKIQFLSEFE